MSNAESYDDQATVETPQAIWKDSEERLEGKGESRGSGNARERQVVG